MSPVWRQRQSLRDIGRLALQRSFRGREPQRHRGDAAGGEADELERAVPRSRRGRRLSTSGHSGMAAADRALVERALALQRSSKLDALRSSRPAASALSAVPLEPSPRRSPIVSPLRRSVVIVAS